MFTVQETKEITYTVNDVKRMVTNIAPHISTTTTLCNEQYKEKAKVGLKLISIFIKEHRYELFNTFSTFKIITNGWSEFIKVEVPEFEQTFSADFIFKHMYAAEQHNYKMPIIVI